MQFIIIKELSILTLIVNVKDGIDGSSGIININMKGTGEFGNLIPEDTATDGTIVFDGSLSGNSINIYDGTLKLGGGNKSILNFGTYGGTLDLQNQNANDEITIATLMGNSDTTLKIDFNAASGEADKLIINSVDNTDSTGIMLDSVNVIADGNINNVKYIDSPEADKIKTISDNITSTVTSGGFFYIFKPNSAGMLEVIRNGNPDEITIQSAIANEFVNAFSLTQDLNVTSGLGTLAGQDRNFTIYGNYYNLSSNTTNTNGISTISGQTLTIENIGKMSGFTTAINNAQNAILNVDSVNFIGNTTDINNDGTLSLSGTNTFESGISGNGNTVILKDITTNNGIIEQNSIIISDKATLNTNASDINTTENIINLGNLELTGGVNSNTIQGDGTTGIFADVTNKALIDQNVIVNSGILTTSADNLGGTVENNSTLKISEGTISKEVTGTGTTIISGTVNANANITQANINIEKSGNITTSADNISSDILNEGTYNITNGTIKNNIDGTGTTNIIGNVISDVKSDTTGKINILKDATLTLGKTQNTIFENASVINAQNGSTISLMNNSVANTNMNNLTIKTDDNINLEIDWGDVVNANPANVEGNILLTKVDLKNQNGDASYGVSNLGSNFALNKSNIELVANNSSNNYLSYDSTTGVLSTTKLSLVDAFSVKTDTNRVYQMTQNEVLNKDLSNMAGSLASLTINGGGYEINGNGTQAATINDATNILNLVNIKNIDGFKDDTFITNYGTITLSNVTLNDKIEGMPLSDANVRILGDSVVNNAINNNMIFLDNGTLTIGQNGDISNAPMLYANGGSINLQNGTIQNTNLGNLVLGKDMNLTLDGNFAANQLDTITANSFTSNDNFINISNINILQPTTAPSFSISPLGEAMEPVVRNEIAQAIRYTGGEIVYSPIYKYNAGYNPEAAVLNFNRIGGGDEYTSFNPSIMAAPVAAQLGGYLTQLQSYDEAFRNMDMYMLMTEDARLLMKNRNKYASVGNNNIIFDPTIGKYENKAGWIRPYATFERVPLRNGPQVSNIAYGTYFGAESELYDLGHGWDGMWSVYGAYNGSHQTYDGVGIYQNGGLLGATAMAYRGNFYTGLTINTGASSGKAHGMYGSENFAMLMAGVASKTGYNFEFARGKFIIQPNFLISYSFVNTFDYKNAAGVKIESDPLHAIQLEPGIKFIGNLENGWQPYAGVSVVWNIMDKTKFMANDVSLPNLSIKPFVKYGVGVRKSWGEKFTGFIQTYITNGGRNGIGLQCGFRWTL